MRLPGIHGPDERAQRSERGQADDRRRRREPEPPPGAGRDPQIQRILHRQQAHGLRQKRARGVLNTKFTDTFPLPHTDTHTHRLDLLQGQVCLGSRLFGKEHGNTVYCRVVYFHHQTVSLMT